MKHQPTEDRLPGGWLRRIAERIASRATCERVLFPLLADLQFEHARARGTSARVAVRARGVLAFWRALGVTSLLASGRYLWAAAWTTREETAPSTRRMVVVFGSTTTAIALALPAVTWHRTPRIPTSAFALMIPSVLVVALPLGVLFAFALAPNRRSLVAHRRGPQSVAGLGALATFVVAAWLTPAANQEFRERMYKVYVPESAGQLSRGDREMTLRELSVRSAELRAAGRGEEAGRLDVEWHKKPALAALCLVFALAGAAVSATTRRGVFRFGAALVVALVSWALLRVGEQAADNGRLLPALAMWGPVVLVAVAAMAALRLAQRRQAASSPDSFGAGSSPA